MVMILVDSHPSVLRRALDFGKRLEDPASRIQLGDYEVRVHGSVAVDVYASGHSCNKRSQPLVYN